MKPDPRVLRHCRTITSVAGIFVAACGGIVLVGWIFGITTLTTLLSPHVYMAPDTAVCLVLAGASLWLLRHPDVPLAMRRAGKIGAILLLLIAGATTYEHVRNRDLGFDHYIFQQKPNAPIGPYRMGPPAALGLTIAAAALLLIDWRTKQNRAPFQYLAIAVALISLLTLIRHLYNIKPTSNIFHWTDIATLAAVALGILAAGLLCAPRTEG